MRITLDLDGELVKKAMRASGQRTKTATIEEALRRLIQVCMRTTLNIDDSLIRKAMLASGLRTKTETIELGLKRLLQDDSRRRLLLEGGSQPHARAPRRRRVA